MVGCPVAFDTYEVAARQGRINDRHINKESCTTHLSVNLVTLTPQLIEDFLLEWGIWWASSGRGYL
jgi:hypothetical protein